MNDKVSIIVPLYNAEQWIGQCIESLIEQTYENIEVLIVNDGSTDRSLEICGRYALNDERVKIISVKNGGVSRARNIGLNAAIGKWVVFVDADDYLDLTIVEKAVICAQENKQKLVCYNSFIIENGKITKGSQMYIGTIRGEEIYAALIGNYHGDFCLGGSFRACWNKIYDLDLIRAHGISFPEKLYLGEDAVFSMKYMQYMDGLYLTNEYGYYYRILENSACRKYKADITEQSIRQSEEVLDILGEIKEYSEASCIKDAVAVMHWDLFERLIYNGNQGVKEGVTTKVKLREEAEMFYNLMKKRIVKRDKMPWANNLIKVQNMIGIRAPFAIQYLVVQVRDKL